MSHNTLNIIGNILAFALVASFVVMLICFIVGLNYNPYRKDEVKVYNICGAIATTSMIIGAVSFVGLCIAGSNKYYYWRDPEVISCADSVKNVKARKLWCDEAWKYADGRNPYMTCVNQMIDGQRKDCARTMNKPLD